MFYGGCNIPQGGALPPLFTDFSEVASGTALTSHPDWSRRDHIGTTTNTISTDTTSPTGRSLAMSVSGVSGDTFGYTRVSGASALTAVEILVLWKVTDVPDTTGGAGPVLRLSSNGQDGYNSVTLVSGGNKMEDAEFAAQTRTGNIGGQVSVSWDTTNWWYTRFQASGTTIRSRTWQYGTAEGSSWTISGTDSTLSSGYAGLMSRPEVAVKYAMFSLGVGGATAPGLNG